LASSGGPLVEGAVSALSPNRSLRSQARSVKEFRYGEHVCKLSADSVVFGRAAGDEVPLWLRAADHWLKAPTDELLAKTDSPTGPVYLPSLVTPRFAQGKRIRYAIYEYDPLIDSSRRRSVERRETRYRFGFERRTTG
jgi:hypothetical protein